jgi:hypothetical protein
MIASHPFFLSQIDRLAALTVRSAVPTISQYRELATADSLISCQQKQRPQPFQPFSSRAVIQSQWVLSLVFRRWQRIPSGPQISHSTDGWHKGGST